MATAKQAAASAAAVAVIEKRELAIPLSGADGAGGGFEDAGSEAYAIPFLKVLQTNSPEVDETHAKHVPGAKPGMILNSVTGDLFDAKEGVKFIPCARQWKFLRWAPRSSSQGFRGEVSVEEYNRMRDAGEIITHEGRDYVALPDHTVDDKRCDRVSDTRAHFGLVIGKDGMPQEVLLSLTSTQIKKSKLLMTQLQQKRVMVTGADGSKTIQPRNMWKNMVTITSVKETNDRGTWFGVHFTQLTDSPEEFQSIGEAFHASVTGGRVKVNYAEAEETSGDAPHVDSDKF